jgi:large subunit ribosomal protein L17
MRHQKYRHKLNRFTSWRKATLKSLLKNILIYQSIKTTRAKAFAVKPLVEKVISLTKKDTLFSRRQAYDLLGEHKLVSLLFQDIGPRFKNKTSGYTRIINLGSRRGDNAALVILELTEIIKRAKRLPKKEKETEFEGETIKEVETTKEKPTAEKKKPKAGVEVIQRPTAPKKPSKKFLGGLRGIFKKERDSL